MTKKERIARVKEFNEKHPLGSQVAVMGENGSRWVGVVAIAPQKDDETAGIVAVDMVEVIETEDGARTVNVNQGAPVVDVAFDLIRARAIEYKRESSPQRVKLTTEERLEAGDKISDAMQAIEQSTSDLEEVKSQVKADIKIQTGIVESNAQLLRAGYAVRSVKCSKAIDFDLGKVTVTRKDTGDVISERDIMDCERAQELQLFPELHTKADDDADAVEGPANDSDGAKGLPDESAKPTDAEMESFVASAVQVLKETRRASTSALQRRLNIGPGVACAVMSELQKREIVSEPNESDGVREILIDLDGTETVDTDSK